MDSDEMRCKELKRSVSGYSPDEVDDPLDSIANEQWEVRDIAVRELEKLDSDHPSREGGELLLGVRSPGLETTVDSARREVEVMIHEAEARYRKMLADTSSKVERVQESYEALRETRGRLDSDLRGLLEGYLKLLDDANSSTMREIEKPLRERLDTEAISAAHAAAAAEERQEEESDSEAHEEVSQVRDDDEEAKPESNGIGDTEPGESKSVRAKEEPSEDDTIVSEESSSHESEGSRHGWFPRRRG